MAPQQQKQVEAVCVAFRAILHTAATAIKTAHWFIVNRSLIDENDNEDPHTLACFLGLTYHEYICLLEVCCLTDHVRSGKQQGNVCVSASKLKQFVQTIPNTDFSHIYSSFFGNNYTRYHVVRLGRSPNASFSFTTQLKLEAQNKCRTPLFRTSSLHLELFEALDDLHYCQSHPFPETALTESDLLNSSNTPSSSPHRNRCNCNLIQHFSYNVECNRYWKRLT